MAEIKTDSIATGSSLNKATWDDFVARLRHDCVGEGVDDHCTSNALFVVHCKRRDYGVSEDYTDKMVVYCDETSWFTPQAYWDDASFDVKARLDTVSQYDNDCPFLEADERDQWGILGDLDDHTVTGYTERWEYVNSHFTKDAAEAFIKRKKHDYPDGLRVYVESQQYTWEFNAIKDAILNGQLVYAEAAVLSASAGKVDAEPEECWQDMTGYGQVKAGDFISFFIGDTHYDERVVEVLDAGTDREELIYNKKKNFYVISKNVLTGFGNVTKFRFFGKQAIDAGNV